MTIEFHVEKETNFIVLHIQDLNVTEKVIFFDFLLYRSVDICDPSTVFRAELLFNDIVLRPVAFTVINLLLTEKIMFDP